MSFDVDYIVQIGKLFELEYKNEMSDEYKNIMKDTLSHYGKQVVKLLYRTLKVYL